MLNKSRLLEHSTKTKTLRRIKLTKLTLKKRFGQMLAGGQTSTKNLLIGGTNIDRGDKRRQGRG